MSHYSLGVPDVPDVLRDVVALRKAVRDELELGRRRGSNWSRTCTRKKRVSGITRRHLVENNECPTVRASVRPSSRFVVVPSGILNGFLTGETAASSLELARWRPVS